MKIYYIFNYAQIKDDRRINDETRFNSFEEFYDRFDHHTWNIVQVPFSCIRKLKLENANFPIKLSDIKKQ